MAEYQIKIVDAFTTERFAGNPCGVVTRADGLDDAQMQRIAREMNLSETAFVFPSKVATFKVRFFTPRAEIPLAGHPTIATMHALAEEGRIDLSGGSTRVTQELKAGVLPVDLARDADGLVRVTMTQAKPTFGAILERKPLAEALGLELADLRADVPPQVVSTGTQQAMVPLVSLDALRRVRPNLSRLGELESANGYFGTHVFALEAIQAPHRAHSRHFSAKGGIAEDPVTGSATGGMSAYLWKHGLLREPRYSVEQGHPIGRPGVVGVEVEADGAEPTTVRIAGNAITVLRGAIEA